MEAYTGFEPVQSDWKSEVLPLHKYAVEDHLKLSVHNNGEKHGYKLWMVASLMLLTTSGELSRCLAGVVGLEPTGDKVLPESKSGALPTWLHPNI